MKSSFCIDLQRFMLIPTKFPLSRNITSPNDKARTILATMHKDVAANGMAIVLSLFEV